MPPLERGVESGSQAMDSADSREVLKDTAGLCLTGRKYISDTFKN